jgi:mono/diheme cytochrome c family protein
VSVIDVEAGREIARVAVVREPVAAAVTPDGRTLVVANHLPADRASSFYVTPVVSFVDAATRKAKHVRLPNGATGLRDACISPDGRWALVTHIIGNYELVPSNVVGGWTNINALSVLDARTGRLVNSIKLDDLHRGAANPWGVACSSNGRWLCVTHAATHELSVIDLPGLIAKLKGGVYASPAVGGIPHDPGILQGIRQRVRLEVEGPRAVAVVGSKAYVAGYFSDAIDVVELGPDPRRLATIALGPEPEWTTRRRGEFLFHDATDCFQQWQSCASCHPDARADALNWDLTNDGVGNPKNTKSMLLAHRTPPAMVTGVRPDAEAAVRAGIEHILFADLPEEDARAIDAYLKSLRPVPSPRLLDGRLSPAARRGKKLFESPPIGCAVCHPAPLYTDRKRHEIGDPGPYDLTTRFDTPTLMEAWRTAPYLHDGRYTTVEQLLIEGKHGLGGGRRERLSEQDIDDLVEFVLSL